MLTEQDLLTKIAPTAVFKILTGFARLASEELWNDPLSMIGVANSQSAHLAGEFRESAVEMATQGQTVTFHVYCILAIYCDPEIVDTLKLSSIQRHFALMLYRKEMEEEATCFTCRCHCQQGQGGGFRCHYDAWRLCSRQHASAPTH